MKTYDALIIANQIPASACCTKEEEQALSIVIDAAAQYYVDHEGKADALIECMKTGEPPSTNLRSDKERESDEDFERLKLLLSMYGEAKKDAK